MSTQKQTFIVWAPDNEGAFEKRMSVRETHIAGAHKAAEEGVLKIGGAMLTPESITGGERKLIGSTLIYEAESLEAVQKIVENDIYYTSDVWDKSKIVVLPFGVAAGSVKLN